MFLLYAFVSSIKEKTGEMGEAVAQIFNSFQDHLNNEQELREVRVFSGAVLGENIFALGF